MIGGAAMPLKIIETPSSIHICHGPEPIPIMAFMPLDDKIKYPNTGGSQIILHELVLLNGKRYRSITPWEVISPQK